MVPTIDVAVGVVIDPDGKVLIAKRPAHTHLGGLWEFPGGKIEAGETSLAALKREFFEEVSLSVNEAQPLLQISTEYPECIVNLDVWKVTDYQGEAKGLEQQIIVWASMNELQNYDFPEVNQAIISTLQQQQ